ncbi:MAG: deoxyribodipyrimidine photolyase [delta proteobacterium ML8_D]|nr:MAG: deoxyribodipyrimidine photolyase [delta proteobacterium ML8_D]
MNLRRLRTFKAGRLKKGPILYWMSRDHRVRDNWALLISQKLSHRDKVPLAVVFCLTPQFLGATFRQYSFMIHGLQEVEQNLAEKDIPFYLISGSPQDEIPEFVKKHEVGCLITDFDPLRLKREWKEWVARNLDIPLMEVDAHNIVPCWLASDKQEYAAYTFRPKIFRALPEFLEEFPPLRQQEFAWIDRPIATDWRSILSGLTVDRKVSEVSRIKPGSEAALTVLKDFLNNKLSHYAEIRNDPNQDGQSNLSPYLHYGQISAQRIALKLQNSNLDHTGKQAFMEELIIRRELSDNFCLYNMHYGSFDGFPQWARKTLHEHRHDPREYLYSLDQFEQALTHDDLWNAAQREMVKTGKMHGYMRMYWAKKILEWTESPEEALRIAVYLNDRYELDGRDPNGYTGIAWSLGGVHDRAWGERKVFGKIRYMSYKGCKAKFNIDSYIRSQ